MDLNSQRPKEYDSKGESYSEEHTRTTRLVAGDYVLTVDPVDGSEAELCPPGEQPASSRRRDPEERAEFNQAAAPAELAVSGHPLLEREEERRRIAELLSRGRCVWLTGPAGAGRSALLDAAAQDASEFAPDGVVRLHGGQRTPTDVLYDLFAAVHHAPLYRPERERLREAVRRVGAVVILDDVEFGGSALDEMLDAAPECAFLLSATPDVIAPSAAASLEEITVSGLSRTACVELLEHCAERPLTDEEADWAADLWCESDGLPLRFVQAGALLRQRGVPRTDSDSGTTALDDDGLPRLSVGTPLVVLLAAGLPTSARSALRCAVALGGELPEQAHLSAVLEDTDAVHAVGELVACGLVTASGPRYRLAHGVLDQLTAAGYDDGMAERAQAVAQHYAWWASHPSAVPERVAAESEAMLAAMRGVRRAGRPSTAVMLAHSAAPQVAVSLHWNAWERVLRGGQEAAHLAGETSEEAYFRHELGLLALCTGDPDRARAELAASIALRGAAPAEDHGAVAGQRALALAEDRVTLPAGESAHASDAPTAPQARLEASDLPTAAIPLVVPAEYDPHRPDDLGGEPEDLARPSVEPPARGGRRRKALAVGAGALLIAVSGTVAALSSASGDAEDSGDRIRTDRSTSQPDEEGGGLVEGDSTLPSDSGSATLEASSEPSASTESSASETASRSTTPSDGPTSSVGVPTRDDSTGGTSGGSGGGTTSGGGAGGTTGSGSTSGDTTSEEPTSGGASEGENTDGGGSDGGSTDGTSTDGGSSEGGTSGDDTTEGGASGTPSNSTSSEPSSPPPSSSPTPSESTSSSPSPAAS